MNRFIPDESVSELMNLWQLSRTMHSKRYDRLIWTRDEFAKLYPKISKALIYKDLSAITEGY